MSIMKRLVDKLNYDIVKVKSSIQNQQHTSEWFCSRYSRGLKKSRSFSTWSAFKTSDAGTESGLVEVSLSVTGGMGKYVLGFSCHLDKHWGICGNVLDNLWHIKLLFQNDCCH